MKSKFLFLFLSLFMVVGGMKAWTPTGPAAGKFYIYNPQHKVYLQAKNTVTSEIAKATVFTLSGKSDFTIAYDNGGTLNYVRESKGDPSWGETSAKWNAEANNGGYYIKQEKTDNERWISYNGSAISYPREGSDGWLIKRWSDTDNNNRRWQFVRLWTVTLNAGIGFVEKSEVLVPNGEKYNFADATTTNSCYTFKGWFDEKGIQYTSETVIKSNDVALEAKWEENHNYQGGFCTKCDGINKEHTGAYQISKYAHLKNFSAYVNAGHGDAKAELAADITTDNTYVPIGTDQNRYHGTFDGKNHTVTLAINSTVKEQALFSVCSTATIKNVNVAGSVYTTGERAAGIVAICNGSGTITFEDCHNQANITTTNQRAAGILGDNYSGALTVVMKNCSNTGVISASNHASALSGYIGTNATVINCTTTGDGTGRYFEGAATTVNTAMLSIGSAQYGTFVAPFDIEVPEGVKAYTISAVEENGVTLALDEIDGAIVSANIPVIVYSVNPVTQNYTATATDMPTAPTEGLMIGSYEQKVVPVGNGKNYILQAPQGKAGFYVVGSKEARVGANRAYLTLDNLSSGNDVKACLMFDGTIDTIDSVEALVNGSSQIFDINGRRLSHLQKGVNIVNGKKVLVK